MFHGVFTYDKSHHIQRERKKFLGRSSYLFVVGRVGAGANVGTTKLVVVLVCCNCRCRCDHLVALVVTSWWLDMKCSFAVIGAFVFGIGGRCG